MYSDGAGLFCGVIRHLLNRGTDCPKVMAATHFHEVFRDGMLDPDDLPVTFSHMQVMLTSMDGTVLGTSSTDGYPEEGSLNDDAESNIRAPSERIITYLYRCFPSCLF